MKTAINQAIEQIEDLMPGRCAPTEESVGMGKAIDILLTLIQTERKQIEDAVKAGRKAAKANAKFSAGCFEYDTASDYFTQTYEQ